MEGRNERRRRTPSVDAGETETKDNEKSRELLKTPRVEPIDGRVIGTKGGKKNYLLWKIWKNRPVIE